MALMSKNPSSSFKSLTLWKIGGCCLSSLCSTHRPSSRRWCLFSAGLNRDRMIELQASASESRCTASRRGLPQNNGCRRQPLPASQPTVSASGHGRRSGQGSRASAASPALPRRVPNNFDNPTTSGCRAGSLSLRLIAPQYTASAGTRSARRTAIAFRQWPAGRSCTGPASPAAFSRSTCQ
jgi:hypothetical protein